MKIALCIRFWAVDDAGVDDCIDDEDGDDADDSIDDDADDVHDVDAVDDVDDDAGASGEDIFDDIFDVSVEG